MNTKTMRLCLVTIFICLASMVGRTSSKPYSSQDEDEELAAESELEHQEASYIVSRHRFSNDADGGRKRTTKMRKDFDDGFFEEFDIDDIDFDAPRDAELQRATTLTNPILPLEFRDSAKKKPKKKNLNRRRLMKKMGVDFDANWMSADLPASMASLDGSDSVTVITENQMAELSRQVSKLNLRSELRDLSASVDSESPNVAKMVDIFEQWLIRKSSCPVTYTWTDLGEYFWPRYIKQGKCSGDEKNGSGKNRKASESDEYDDSNGDDDDDFVDAASAETSTGGCSWPEGMKCVQGEAKILHLLRWHCRRRKKSGSGSSISGGSSNNKRRKCKWYKVPYPVISSCKCACH